MESTELALNVLRTSGVFGTLDATILTALAEHLTFQTVRGGDLVLREGDASDSMLFVVSGGLRVSRRKSDGTVELYNEVRRGQGVGEIGLILERPRTSDVTAIRDSTLAVLSRASFETLLMQYPIALNRVFVQTTYDFMRFAGTTANRLLTHVFTVIPLHEGADAASAASGLANALSALGRVHHLQPPSDPKDRSATDAGLHGELEDQFDFLVYEAEWSPSSWTRHSMRQADQVIFVAASDADFSSVQVDHRWSDEPGLALKRKHLLLLHPETEAQPRNVERWKNLHDIERVYPLRREHRGDFSRLARFLTGKAVGVVLGGGGARGFAHLGALRALEEAGISIDLLGGNSMGALIGAQYAMGLSLDEIMRRTQVLAAGKVRLTLPLVSLVSNRAAEHNLRKMFGEIFITDLWLPYFSVACNLTKGDTKTLESGPLWRAIMASNSPAGLFPPVLDRGDLLVDGAILDNVPVEAMRVRLGTPTERRKGNGTIIAIDVDSHEGPSADPELDRLSTWGALKNFFSPSAHPPPNISEILYSAGHIGGANQRWRTIEQADHYLEPPVSEFSLTDYRRAEEIVEIGYGYAVKAIESWNLKDPN